MKDYSDNKICMEKTLFDLSVKGLKTATTRMGARNYALGYGTIYTPDNPVLSKLDIGNFCEIIIVLVMHKTADNLTDEDARKEGYANRHVLYEILKSFYPDLTPDSIITIVEYRIRRCLMGRLKPPAGEPVKTFSIGKNKISIL